MCAGLTLRCSSTDTMISTRVSAGNELTIARELTARYLYPISERHHGHRPHAWSVHNNQTQAIPSSQGVLRSSKPARATGWGYEEDGHAVWVADIGIAHAQPRTRTPRQAEVELEQRKVTMRVCQRCWLLWLWCRGHGCGKHKRGIEWMMTTMTTAGHPKMERPPLF